MTEGKRAQVSLHSIHTNVRKLFAALYMFFPAYYRMCPKLCEGASGEKLPPEFSRSLPDKPIKGVAKMTFPGLAKINLAFFRVAL